MVKLSVTCACILLLVGAAVPAAAQISYCKDFLEPGNPGGGSGSLKTFDEEWTLGENETISVDIWINDVPESQLLTAGFFIAYDPAMVTIVSVEPYDGTNGPEGPWDPGLTQSFQPKDTPDAWFFVVGNLACADTDSDSDIILGKVTLQSKTSGSTDIHFSTAPGFDTVVGCSQNSQLYDTDIILNTISLNKGGGTSSTTTSPLTTTSTSPSTTTTAAGSTTTTEPDSHAWKVAYAMMWGEDSDRKLSLLRTFRDELVARNEVARNYVALLYQHSSEIAGVFIKNPLLCREIRRLVGILLPSIDSFFETEQLALTAGQKELVESFLNRFALETTPELKDIILHFRKDLKNGRLVSSIS